MEVQNVIASKANDGAILIEAKSIYGSIRLLGSTMPTSNVPATASDFGDAQQLVLYPEKGVDGVVAFTTILKVPQGKGKVDVHEFPAFYLVHWKDEKPVIELVDRWVPSKRIGQVKNCAVDVVIQGKRFSSYPSDGVLYVPNGNLLCCYLWGTATAAEVLHAAVQQKLEPTLAQRVEKLIRENRQLQPLARRTEAAEQHINLLEKENKVLTSSLVEARKEILSLRDSVAEFVRRDQGLNAHLVGAQRSWAIKIARRFPEQLRPLGLRHMVNVVDGVK